MSEEKKKKTGIKNKIKSWLEAAKSDPQTLEEANKKTTVLCIGCGIVSVIFVILFCFIHILFAVIWAVASVGIIFYFKFILTKRNKRNFCADCGARFDYEKCVSWEVSEVERKSTPPTTDNPSGKYVVQKDVATVVFTCTCKDCGSERSFSEKYDITVWYYDGTIKEKNLKNEVKNYFKL